MHKIEKTEEKLKRRIGPVGLSANLINIMIGAGIFTLPAIVAAGLGSASIYAFLFCGVLISLVMLCFAEVGSKVTTSGGVYAYIHTAFGPYFGFLTVIIFSISAISADAAVANAIADVFASVFPILKTAWLRIIFFFLIFGALGIVNVIGVSQGMRLVKIITLSKLIPLLLLVIFSWGEVNIEFLVIAENPTLVDIGKISLILFFAFQGAESGLSVSGEVIKPQKTIPKAIVISISCVLILYILIQTVSQGILGDALPSYKDNPLSMVAEQVFGPIGFTLITVGAAISMLGYLSSEVLSMPRVLFRAAKDNVIKIKPLSKVHSKFATPYIAVITYASLGFIFACFGGFEELAIISSAAILLVYFGVSLAAIKLRTRNIDSKTEGSFKLPGGYSIPILSALIIIWFLTNLSTQEISVFIGLIILLTIIYFTSMMIEGTKNEK